MKISEIYKTKKLPVSFEIFPPKGDLDMDTLHSMLNDLHSLSPDFISVTCSAGGVGNSDKTVDIASIVQNEYKINSVAHLTCINSNKKDLKKTISDMKARKIENILALRGDRVEGCEATDFAHASDLIKYLSNQGFCIGAACYPEGHVECDNPDKDIDYLKIKQDSGAEFFVSQLFFTNDYFYNFREKAVSTGIKQPIIPAVMPILSKSQISRMIFMCGASLPSEIIRLLNKYENQPDDLREAGIEYAAKQILALINAGVDGIHIYTMNKPDIARKHIQAMKNAGY